MKIKILLAIILILVIISASFAALYIFSSQNKNAPLPLVENLKKIVPSKLSKEVPLTSPISGNITLLSTDLNLFDWEHFGGEIAPETKYYDTGTFNTGDFKGYKRIAAVQEAIGPGGPSAYIFATNDDKIYVTNGNPVDLTKYPETDYNNPFYGMNRAKVTKVANLDDLHPDVIKLDSNFVLFKRDVPSESVDTGKKDSNGYQVYTTILTTDFSKNQLLDFNLPDLKIYASVPYRNPDPQSLKGKDKTLNDIETKYTNGLTQVYVVDPSGLAVSYALATAQNFQTYKSSTQDYPDLPNLRFDKTQVTTSEKLYTKYDGSFPGACGGNIDTTILQNVNDSDMAQIGTFNGMAVYKPTNKAHPLYTLAYNRKVDLYGDSFKYGNPGVAKPTFEEYVAKNPLIIIKDFWGRWVALGEYDYILPGGCGKPVIYLYPTKPTSVSVKFLTGINLTTQIPTYNNGWNVFVYPDGKLVDLQPQYTNCKAIDTNHPGSEYAQEACTKNSYPYIYWSGNVKYNPYPIIKDGWVVAKEDLSNFLDTKLSEVGLNLTERNDMESFWLPRILSENAPYYRISFLQTSDMNTLAPMQINPQPTTVFRIFLDYQALDSKPKQEPNPQKLNTLVRKGFTVVEWGGLLK